MPTHLFKLLSKNWLGVMAVVSLVGLGAALRLHNSSPYLFYPDSYQNLVVAHNLQTYHSPVGQLGPYGMGYPDFVGWTRPLFAFLIMLITRVASTSHATSISSIDAGRLVSLAASIITIPLMYFAVWRIFRRHTPALVAAGLLTISFSHTVWSGFVLTESTGVMTLTALLAAALSRPNVRRSYLNLPDILTGLALAVCILARYEYAVLLVPLTAKYITSSLFRWQQLATVVQTTVVALALWFTAYPLPFSMSAIWEQLHSLLVPLIACIFGVILVRIIWFSTAVRQTTRKLAAGKIYAKLHNFSQTHAASIKLTTLLLTASIIGAVLANLIHYDALKQFILNDFVIAALALAGLPLLVKHHRRITVFVLPSIMLLALAYYRINPAMERYYTHLLPLLLVPAALAGEWGINYLHCRSRNYKHKQFGQLRTGPAIIVLTILAVLTTQTATTYRGIHKWDSGIWFRPGYEQVSALKLKELIKQKQNLHQNLNSIELLITSLPEPYFIYTGHSTTGLAMNPPYVTLGQADYDKTAIVVNDMAMRRLYPGFAHFLQSKLPEKAIGTYTTGTPLRYIVEITPEAHPVTIYRIGVGELVQLLASYYTSD